MSQQQVRSSRTRGKRIRRRLAAGLLPLVIAGTLGSAPARAEPPAGRVVQGSPANQAATLTTCYGGAVRSVFQVGGWGGDAGPFTTSSRCLDINVRNDSSYGAQACVVFIDRTNSCNYWTYLPARSGWFVVAANVRDSTRFKVRFANTAYQYNPLVSYVAY